MSEQMASQSQPILGATPPTREAKRSAAASFIAKLALFIVLVLLPLSLVGAVIEFFTGWDAAFPVGWLAALAWVNLEVNISTEKTT